MLKRISIRTPKYAIIWSDPDTGLILKCNKAAEALLERKKKNIIGCSQRTLYPPEKADYYTKKIDTHASMDEILDLEGEILTASGRVLPVQIYAGMTQLDGKPAIKGIFEHSEERTRAAEAIRASELRYRRLFETAKDGIIILDAKTGKIDDINPFLEDMLGYARAEMVGKKLWEIGPINDIKTCKEGFLELQSLEYIRYEDLPLETKDGRLIEVEFVSNVYMINSKRVIQCNIRDITQRKRAERAAKEAHEFVESIVSTIGIPLLVLSTDLTVISANRSYYETFQVAHQETVGRTIYKLGSQQWDRPELHEVLDKLQDKGTAFNNLELACDFPTIGRRTMLLNARKLYRESMNPEAILITIEDITERALMQNELRDNAERFKYRCFHDSLTSLYNRDYFSEQMAHLGKDLARAVPLSIICIDIDGLKIINDSLGHKAGDDLLIESANILSECFREVDVVARIGGDEFCVILPGADQTAAMARKEMIMKKTRLHNRDNPPIPIHMSVGVATTYNAKKETIYEIFQRADENMYQNKVINATNQNGKTIDLLLAALAERDFVTQGHAERLSQLAALLAERLNLPDDTRNNLILLAKVHDIGKVGIPDNILFKPRKLTAEEQKTMKKHAKIGHNLICRSKELFHIADLVLHHHEFWNGKGYTEGLAGEQIPLECRLFSIMDAYDAMTNTRPYREAMSVKQAIEELKRCSGTQFEPKLVNEFVQFVGNEREQTHHHPVGDEQSCPISPRTI